MAMKNAAIFEKKLTCQFIIHMWNFDPSTQKCHKFAL